VTVAATQVAMDRNSVALARFAVVEPNDGQFVRNVR
jgi:hypothetical protein